MSNLQAARVSLEGLSLGDAFGDRFFGGLTAQDVLQHTLPEGEWRYTDDTNMALSIYEILRKHGSIDQAALALSFGEHYDHHRKYGSSMHGLLMYYAEGKPWTIAQHLFEGQGSYGNGAAMRVAPLGAYFADDLVQVVEQARLSAIVTHTHAEGIAGAIAVAVAAAYAQRLQGTPAPSFKDFLSLIVPHVPDSEVKSGIRRAMEIQSPHAHHAAAMLGSGNLISAQDTVPYALWCAANHLANFENALWTTVSGYGDMDTNCAIVGGIVAAYVGEAGLPAAWYEHREALPEWSLGDA